MSLRLSIPWAGRLFGALLALAGLALVVVGVMLWPGDGLAGYCIGRPAGSMTATAVGAGGAKPTHYEAGYTALGDDLNSFSVPTTPTVYLEPVSTTSDGAPAGVEPAWWKVWWDPKAQTKAVVSLQQHLTSDNASEAAAELDSHLLVPSHFGFTTYRYTLISTSRVPKTGGIIDYLWAGTATDGTGNTVSVRLAGFSVAKQTAAVTLSTSGSRASERRFDQLVASQSDAMEHRTRSQELLIGCGLLVLVGGLTLLVASVLVPRRVRQVRRAGALNARGPPMAPVGYRIFAPGKSSVVLLDAEPPLEGEPDGQDSFTPSSLESSKLANLPPPIDGSLARPEADKAKTEAVREQPELPHPPPFRTANTAKFRKADPSDQSDSDGLLREPRRPDERLPWEQGMVEVTDAGIVAEEPEEVEGTSASRGSGGEAPGPLGGIEFDDLSTVPDQLRAEGGEHVSGPTLDPSPTSVEGGSDVVDQGGLPSAQPGWYTDPISAGGRLRFWSGSSWTEHVAVRGDGY